MRWPSLLLVATLTQAAPLTVRLTAPTLNAEVGGTVSLAARVDGAAARVDFLDGGIVVGTAAQAPYRLDYRPAPGQL